MGVSVREIALKDGGVSFSIDIYFKGQRQQVKTNIRADKTQGREYQRVKRQAEAKAADLEEQLKIDPAAVFLGKERRSTDFLEYFERVILHEKNGEPLYKNTLKHLQDFNGKKSLPMDSINQTWAEQFRAYIDGLTLKETTKANYLHGLKVVLNQAAREHLVSDFTRSLKPFKKNDVSLKYLTIDQIKSIEATPCTHPAIKAAFLFACFTGLRISDLRALHDADIHHDGERLTIRFKMKKNGKWQYLVMGAQALKYLEKAKLLHKDRPADDDRIFLLPGATQCLNVLRAWGKAAGIPFNLTPHCSRHTFAVMSLQNGVDLFTLSKLLGHSTIAITQVYAKVVDETKTAAMDKLPSW